jgi:hypothetical protein
VAGGEGFGSPPDFYRLKLLAQYQGVRKVSTPATLLRGSLRQSSHQLVLIASWNISSPVYRL